MTAAIGGLYCTGPSAPGGPGPLPAPAFPLDQLMLSHRDRGFGQVEDLAALHPGDRPARKARTAPPAAARLMAELPVRPGRLRQRRALMPVLPARLAAALFRSDRGRGGGLPSPQPTKMQNGWPAGSA